MKLNMAQGGILLENTYTTTMKLQPLQCGVPEADDSLSLTFAYIARRTYLRVFFLSNVLRLVTFCCYLAVDVDQIPRDFLGE